MGRPDIALMVVLLVILSLGGVGYVAAQSDEIVDLYDFNGDGEVFCNDFREEFPDTYTDQATAAMNRFPDELSRLNNDPDEDDTACDGQPGAPVPETPEPELQPRDSAPAPDTTPAPPAANTTGCDSTLVGNGRVTICAGEDIEVLSFESFEAFAARAQNGFGQFSGSGSGPSSVSVPRSPPASGASGGTTLLQSPGAGGNQVITTEQQVRKKAKAKAKKDKRSKERKRHRDRERQRK